MPFDFFDGLGFLADLLSVDLSFKSSSITEKNSKYSEKSKYTTEIWSGSFLVMASVFYFIVFKNPMPEENTQTLLICILAGFLLSFIVFFCLYHLGLFYFKNLCKLLLFSFSLILLKISIVLIVYFKLILSDN